MDCSYAIHQCAQISSVPKLAYALLEAFKTLFENEHPFYCNTLLQEVSCSSYLQRIVPCTLSHIFNYEIMD